MQTIHSWLTLHLLSSLLLSSHKFTNTSINAIENDALEEEGRFPDTEQDGDFRRSRRLAEQRFKLFDQCEENSVGSQDSTIVEYDDCNIKGIECEESLHNNNNNNDDNEDEGSDMEDFISDDDDVDSERSSSNSNWIYNDERGKGY